MFDVNRLCIHQLTLQHDTPGIDKGLFQQNWPLKKVTWLHFNKA